MRKSHNTLFLACNYNDTKIKSHFNKLKERLEDKFPLRVILIDKERRKGARDIWTEVRNAIEISALAVFDVSAFRPNVVLELGYALGHKDEEDIIVTFDERKKRRGAKADWLLSDIGHLDRKNYKTLGGLDLKMDECVEK